MYSKKKFQDKKKQQQQQSDQKPKQWLQQDKICRGEILCVDEMRIPQNQNQIREKG